METVKELIRIEADNTLSFGDFQLNEKAKKENFEFLGDLYKIKTFKGITRLEKNDGFVYESVPGTAVMNMSFDTQKVNFKVSGTEDSQITLGMSENTKYCIKIAGEDVGCMTTGIGGKLNLSIALNKDTDNSIEVEVTTAEE